MTVIYNISIWFVTFLRLTFCIQFHTFLHLLYFSAKIGFVWNINEHAWNANFRALEAYHAEHVSIVVYIIVLTYCFEV